MSQILMPRLSDTMEEGVVSAWHKKPGDPVAAGDALVDIETDKALMEYEAYEDGVLGEILVAEGETARIGTPIATLVSDGAAPEPATSAPGGAGSTPPATADAAASAPAAGVTAANGTPVPADTAVVPATGGRVSRPPSSPLARRIARDNGVDLAALTGSGPGGRIVRADVEAAARAAVPAGGSATSTEPATAVVTAPAAPSAATGTDPDTEQVPLNRIRQITARRLAEAKQAAPHIYLTRVVDVDALLDFRATLNTALAPAKVSVNDLIVKACAAALRADPALNVSFAEDHLLVHRRVHIGVAVAMDDGLVVPVVHDADRKSVSQIGAETRDLAVRARERKLKPPEMSGGTFTVSNLGMYGVDAFTAVINPPEAAILAVGAAREEVAFQDGEVVPRRRMSLTLSVDHRAADGATGANFLARLAELLENPLRIVA
jgi:pyruvate dehydrogenase E2 component (dihydrolipoamide acetyltransferase)